MLSVSFTKVDPSGNITLIVGSFVPRAEQSRVAAALMQRDKTVEQVGFLEKPEDENCAVRLQMMGGEFCGNASLSAAAVMLKNACAPVGLDCALSLEVSGAPETVLIDGRMADGESFVGSVSMPLPESISEVSFLDGFEEYSFPLVRFSGICHAVVPDDALGREKAERLIGKWCADIKAEALGLMFLDKKTMTLTPLVYVASTDTAVWEGSCASGTSAVAAYLAEIDGEMASVTLTQPRGSLSAEATYSGGMVRSLRLRGSAVIRSSETLDLIF